jgi:hypothetical protein
MKNRHQKLSLNKETMRTLGGRALDRVAAAIIQTDASCNGGGNSQCLCITPPQQSADCSGGTCGPTCSQPAVTCFCVSFRCF